MPIFVFKINFSDQQTRKGIAIPLILVILIIFFSLFFALSQSSVSSYNQAILVVHNLKARMFALAVIEEATAFLHDSFSDPNRLTRLQKEKMIPAIFAGQEYKMDLKPYLETEALLFSDLPEKDKNNPGGAQGGERLVDFDKLDLKKKSNIEIIEAEARFHDFHPIQFSWVQESGMDLYKNPTRFYSNRLEPMVKRPPVGDFYGFVTIRAMIRFGVVEREMIITRDVKISEVSPMGRDYVLFNFGAPPSAMGKIDLNSEGKLIVDAAGVARIRIAGPYSIDVEGYPDGTGPSNPSGLSFPQGSWLEESFIPSPRAITVNGFLFSSTVGRPKDTSGMTMSIGIGSTGGLSFTLGGDPGYKGIPEMQDYWSAKVENGKQNFSITGPSGSFRPWKGILYKTGAPMKSPSGYFTGLESLKNGMEGRIDGYLIGNYHHQNYTKIHFCMSLGSIISGFSGLFNSFGSGSGTQTGTTNQSPLDEKEPFSVPFFPYESLNTIKTIQALCSKKLPSPPLSYPQELENWAQKTEKFQNLACGFLDFAFHLINQIPALMVAKTPAKTSGNTSTTGSTGSEAWGVAQQIIQICTHRYTVKKVGEIPYYYALRSGYSAKVDKLESALGLINDLSQSLGTDGASQSGGFGAALTQGMENMADNAEAALIKKNKLSTSMGEKEEAMWVEDAYGVLPSGFKPVNRICTRKYKTLKEYMKKTNYENEGESVLYLDGNLWIDDLTTEKDIRYFGKGYLFSAYTPGSFLFTSSKEASIRAFLPADPKKDHLSIFYRNVQGILSGEGQLTLKGDFHGSLYSYQGVKPEGNRMIYGNYINELFHKAKFGPGNHLNVSYNKTYLEGDTHPFQWFTVSISPKISGTAHNIRQLSFKGEGSEGIETIVTGGIGE